MSAAAGALVPASASPRVFATLRAALGLLWNHPVQLLVPYGVVSALLIAESLVVIAVTDGERPPIAANMALGLATGIVGGVGGAAVVVATAALVAGGTPSLAGTLDALLQRRAPLIALAVLAVIVLWVATMPVLIVDWIMLDSDDLQDRAVAISLTTVLWLPVSLYLEARFAVAFQLFLLEGAGPVDAFRRSWHTMKGNVLRMVGILLVMAVVGIVLAVLATVLIALFSPSYDTTRTIQIIATGALSIIPGALTIVAVTLYYLRLRESAP